LFFAEVVQLLDSTSFNQVAKNAMRDLRPAD
jgi:hypothetical protein